MIVHFKLQSPLAPEAVLSALTDFGPSRSEVWPNVDDAHFKVHGQGPGWAEVTEGSSVAGGVWERERYSWDSANRTVAIETLDSNTWGPGSRWDYRLAPGSGGGTLIEANVVRNGKGWKGRLIGVALSIAGAGMLRSQMKEALDRLSTA
ncbi:MAG TPA: SRPBCC family protein [Candidatus Dormibacteraeota bacterium]|nr:SRPBCC family protein [Candidatus Dormibacteraeota bacterium]